MSSPLLESEISKLPLHVDAFNCEVSRLPFIDTLDILTL